MALKIITLSGASGSGKSSYCRELMARDPRFFLITSFTTREARTNDLRGEYVHVAPSFFEDQAGKFLWIIDVHGHRYGTTRSAVIESVQSGSGTVGIMLIEPGSIPVLSKTVLAQGADIAHFYCLSPSAAKLRERFGRRIERGDMTPEEAEQRIADCADADARVKESGIQYVYIPANLSVSQAAVFICGAVDGRQALGRG